MAIEKQEVEKLAKLSRLKFTDEELHTFIKEFESILEQVKAIDSVDTSNVDLKECGDRVNFDSLQEDIERQGLSQADILMNAPSAKDGAFLVPITVEEGK